jgi:membrane dipeptidase
MKFARRQILHLAAGAAVLPAASRHANAQSPASQALLVEGHAHITNRVYWEGIDPWKPQSVGQSYARARAAGVNVLIDNISPYGYERYDLTVKQVGRLIETFYRVLEANRDKMELALSAVDVRRIVASGKMAVILGIEAGFDQDGDLDILRLWHRLGVRLIQFSSHITNSYSDAFTSASGETKWSGINERGLRLVAEMNRLGIIIDITHSTEEAQRQIISASRAPVVVSHVGVQALCNNPANFSDDLLRALAAKGGLIGIKAKAENISQHYFDWQRTHPPSRRNGLTVNEMIQPKLSLLMSPDRDYGAYIDAADSKIRELWREAYAQTWQDDPEGEALVPTADEWAEHVQHAIAIAGPANVGIGLDAGPTSLLKDFNNSSYRLLVEALRKRNAPAGVLGDNWVRVMDAAKVP